MKRTLLLLLISIFTVSLASAQYKRCGTTEYMNRLKAADPSYESRLTEYEKQIQDFEQRSDMRSGSVVVVIPVVFHILYNGAAQNVSDNRIYDQVTTLNKDYGHYNLDTGNTPSVFASLAANTNIQFCMASKDPDGLPTTGIIRKQVTVSGFDPLSNDNLKYTALGGDDAWDRNKYLNVWVSNYVGASIFLLGISQLPGGAAGTDGCSVYYKTVGGDTYHGTMASYDLGRTLTHEVGHWLNLHHVWADDGGNCSGSDFVTDTPNQEDENYGCPSFPEISCSNGPNGDMFMNYMDYTNDNCMNLFTTGQSTRMTSILNGPRAAIKSSDGCEDVTGIAAPLGIVFSLSPNPSAGIFSVSFIGDVTDITVGNMLGELVWSRNAQQPGNVQQIDLSAQPAGVYMITLRSSKGVAVKKLMLQQ